MNFENLRIKELRKMTKQFGEMQVALEKYKIKYPKEESKFAEDLIRGLK